MKTEVEVRAQYDSACREIERLEKSNRADIRYGNWTSIKRYKDALEWVLEIE